ncbi:MAG: DUF1223 domain-containing protein [Candidatus Sulfotelmatobacter sp.]
MRTPLLSTLAIFAVAAWVWVRAAETPRYLVSHSPVLVELFTSEGCSSCPPADALLSKFDRQSRTGAEIVVLSEHVDYWNDLGWKDPYSSHVYSDRQNTYADRLGLSSVYTPQMVVDGSIEFVGSSARSANEAFGQALGAPKIPVRLSSITVERTDILRAHIETEALTDSFGSHEAEVYVAVALNHAESQVSRGENGGQRLAHTAVVRTLFKIGSVHLGQSFAQDVQLKLESGTDPHNLRLIAFLQQPHQGRVIGTAVQSVSTN